MAEGTGAGRPRDRLPPDLHAWIRGVLGTAAGLDMAGLGDDADLHAAGLTSFGTVEVMLRIEETLGVEFPDSLLTAAHFRSVRAIADATRLLAGG